MTLIEVLKLLSQHKIQISLDESNHEQLKISAAKGAMTKEIMQLLKARKPELLAWAQEKHQQQQNNQPITPRTTDEPAPLSFAQQRLWFIEQLAPGSATYNVPAAIVLRGNLDIARLNQVIDGVIARHESLRTVFIDNNGEARQKILPPYAIQLAAEPCSIALSDNAGLLKIASEELLKPFDLTAGPALRVRLLALANDADNENVHLLLLNLHHIITDGWSNGILMADIATGYQTLSTSQASANTSLELAPIDIQYADYALWQHEQLPPDQLAAKTQYWQQQLKNPEVLELPADYPRKAQKSGRGSTYTFNLPSALRTQVNQLATRIGCTDFVVWLAAWQALLRRLSGQTDICVGSPIAGRTRPEIQQTIGFFVNTLALRADLSDNPTFDTLVKRSHQTFIDANEHQDVPFESVVESLNIPRDMSTTPVFQVVISYQKQAADAGLAIDNLQIEPLQLETHTAKFDMTLGVVETETGIACSIEYDTDLYRPARIEALARHLHQLLDSALSAPQTPVDQLNVLTDTQKKQLLERAGRTSDTSIIDFDASLPWQFEQWVGKQPDAIAVQFDAETLTYKTLDHRASQFAHYLQQQGFGSGDILAIGMQRSCDMVALALAALKTGGAYLPIDPEYPQDRITYMLEDSAAKQIICLPQYKTVFAESLAEGSDNRLIDLDSLKHASAEFDVHWRCKKSCDQGEQLAYLMYTSGSTGKPKGVLVPQRGMTRLALDTLINFSAGKRIGFLGNVAFDASAWEIWGALLSGGSLIGIDKETLLDSEAFAQKLANGNVDIALLTVALFNVMASENAAMFGSFEQLIVGGEAPDPVKIRAVMESQQPPAQIINAYGPTENSVVTTYHPIAPSDLDGAGIPLGHPITNTFCYVLDKNNQLVAPGVAGELCTSGIGLARGYLNKPEQTASSFISNPFKRQHSGDTSEWLYRTGDICRWNANGQLEILGRADDQVKLRGFRIELDEITHQLNALNGIRDAIVIARKDTGDTYLAAYIVSQTAVEDHQQYLQHVKETLAENLPKFMVPQAFMVMDALPQTANGKLDKKALPIPELQLSSSEYVAPRNDQEAAMADVWQQVLELDQVGIHDNFFDIGGHSLLATRTIARLRESLDLDLVLRDLFDNPTIAELALHIQIIEGQQQGLKNRLPKLVSQIRPTQIPLSYAQQRMWFIDQLMPGSAVYNMPFALRLRGSIDIPALQKAFAELVQRHESLRTRVVSEKGDAWQEIDTSETFTCPAYVVEEDDQELLLRASEFATAAFDLANGPLFKAELIQQQASGDWVLLMNMHHVISDGWSMEILIRDLFALYTSDKLQLPHALPALSVQYADYAIWQRDWLKGDVLATQVSYWKDALAGAETLELPIDYSRPATLDNRGAQLRFDIPAETARGIRALSDQQSTTLYMTLLAAFGVLLGKYANQQDVAIGSPMAGRSAADLENMIGLFVNTLVMRVDWENTDSFANLLKQVKNTSLGAYQHQDIAFEQLVDELGVPRSLSQTPLFQVMLILQTAAEASNIDKLSGQFDGIEVEALTDTDSHTTAKFDITLNVIDLTPGAAGKNTSANNGGLSATIEYRTSLFKRDTIQRLADHFVGLLEAIVAAPDQPIGKLALISDDEKARQLDWQNGINATAKSYPSFDALHQIIEQQALQTPDAIAVVNASANTTAFDTLADNDALTYDQLNQQANQLAHHLISLGLQPNQPVGVCLYRSPRMSVALLAILKAAGAYVPFDPDFPIDRLSFMAEDTGIRILISDASVAPAQQLGVANTIWMDDLASMVHGQSLDNPTIPFGPDALFNIIYTSGSTGNPKGVMVPHQGIINRLQWMQEAYPIDANDRILQKTPYSFDVSVWELFWPLMQGATLVFAKPDGHKDPIYLRDTIKTNNITVLHFVPSMLGVFLQTDKIETLASIRQVFCSGEALQLEHGRRFYGCLPHARLDNLYGPTEASIDVSWYACVADETRRSIPIGKPIANTQLHILDDNLNLVPQGIAGELYIGGKGLALGYLNRDELTASTFIDNPFKARKEASSHPSEKLYKTGDVARLLDDGNIEYLGRTDHQIKIRGLRIELGEIESRLQNLAGIDEAIVTAQSPDGSQENLQLVGYYLAENAANNPSNSLTEDPTHETIDSTTIKHNLSQELPEYMVPTHLIRLDAWPLSANGKINRKALPAPDWQSSSASYVAAVTPAQHQLVAIWASLLPKIAPENLGINDNFFELGGHSLLATRVVADIAHAFDLEISVRTIFEAPTIAQLAAVLEQSERLPSALPPVTAVMRDQPLPLSFNQQRLWFIYKLAPEAASYNMPMALRLDGTLNVDALQQAFEQLIQRHEIFRTRIVEEGDNLSLTISETIDLPFAVETIETTETFNSPADEENDQQQLIRREAGQPFDLTSAPLLRVKLFRYSDQQNLLLITLHHIIADAASLEVFVSELSALYLAADSGTHAALLPLAYQYADYAWWQQHVLAGENLDRQMQYWQQQLAGAPTQLQLPTDKPRPAQQTQNGHSLTFSLQPELVSHIREFALTQGLTPFMVLLGAQQLLLGRISRQDDVCIGVPVAGRHHKGTESLIGFFVNAMAIRNGFSDNPDVVDFYARVKDQVLGAFAHQDAPIEQVIEQLNLPRNTAFNPLVQVGFNYFTQSAAVSSLDTGNLTISSIEQPVMDAKYDMIWSFQDDQNQLQATIEFNTDLFEQDTIKALYEGFCGLVGNMLMHTGTPVKKLPLISQSALLAAAQQRYADVEQVLPLTPMQQALTIDTLLDETNRRNYLGWVHHTGQQIDAEKLQGVIDQMVTEIPILRARMVQFDHRFAEPGYQVILSPEHPGITLESIDLSHLSEADLIHHCRDKVFAPYQMADAPLVRFALINKADGSHAILTAGHHAAVDGISVQNLTERYIALYEADSTTSIENLPKAQYADFVLQNYDRCDSLTTYQHWQSVASKAEALNGQRQPGKNGLVSQTFDDSSAHFDAISAFCRENRTTPAIYIKALYALTLQSYCLAENDFYFTEVLMGRPKGHLSEVGCYFETQPVYVDHDALAGKEEFTRVIRHLANLRKQNRVSEGVSNALQAQLFEQGNTPFLFNFYTLTTHLSINDIDAPLTFVQPVMDNAVNFVAMVVDDHLRFDFSFPASEFNGDDFVQRLLHLSQQVLAGTQPLSALTLQLHEEILPSKSTAAPAYPYASVVDWIQAQVEVTPNRVATRDAQQHLTYTELNQQANHLAQHLIDQYHVSLGQRVAICHSATTPFMVALLATLKTGACYIPVDVNYPAGRIEHILSDSDAVLTLTESDVVDKISGAYLALDQWQCPIISIDNPNVAIDLDDPLYVIYTSGSTGLPKGAQLKQRGELNLIEWYNREFAIAATDKVLIVSATGFDLTQKNLLAPLCAGAEIVFPQAGGYDPAQILQTITEHNISLINCAPSAFYPLAENHHDYAQQNTLRLVLFGGEPIRMPALLPWLQSTGCQAELVNMYGPTECTDIASYFRILEPSKYEHTAVPIGTANANVQLHLLDSANRLLPRGFAGELTITGEGVGDGYIGHASDKNSAFIDHPLLGRAYKTGDIVHQNADGNFIFLNRKDHQVKLRGLRIELAEIEFALKQLTHVDDALVQVIDDRLVAHVMTGNGEVPDNWRSNLANQLTDYMVPQSIAAVSQWPLTANGKIDRKALPAVGTTDVQEQVAPRNAIEAELLTIWQDVLGTQAVGVYDNFFDLGGHSLLAARAVSRVRDHFGKELALREVFFSPTIAAIAEMLASDSISYSALPAIEPVDREPYQNHFPLSFAQQRLWLLEQIQAPSSMYNMPFALQLNGSVDSALLENGLKHLVARHESLRTHIVEKDGIAWQSLLPADAFTLDIEQLDIAANTSADQYVARWLQTPFKLGKEPLFRACLLKRSSDNAVLMLNMHHIITDGLSGNILLAELAQILTALASNDDTSINLPSLKAQYIDYSLWQQQVLTEDVIEQQLGYWRKQLANPPVLDLPMDAPRLAGQSIAGKQLEFSVSSATTQRLQQLAQQHQATLTMLMLGAYGVLLHRYSGQDDITIGMPSANRPQAALEGIIGFFVNTLVIRNRFESDTTVSDLIASVKSTLGDSLKHQDIPFERLLDALDVPRDLSHSPMFQAFFSLQSADAMSDMAADESLRIGGTDISAYQLSTRQSDDSPSELATAAKFEISLSLLEKSGQLTGTLEYRTALFKPETMARFANHFVLLLDAIAGSAPTQPINQLAFIDADETDQQLSRETATAVDHQQHIVAMFEQQAEARPAAIAASSPVEGDQLTYAALNDKANRLAHYLLNSNTIHAGDRIAILQQPGTDFIVAVLATLKLGCSYLPLDPNHPDERLQFILDDADVKAVLTHKSLGQRVSQTATSDTATAIAPAAIIELDQLTDMLAAQPHHNPAITITENTPVYVIYTSGSTGNPKGVEVVHRGETNLIHWYTRTFAFNASDKVLIASATGFDLTQKNFFAPLISGGELVFADTGFFDADKLVEQIHQHGITRVNCAPSVLYALLDNAHNKDTAFPFHALSSLKTVLLGGEPVRLDKVRPWLEATAFNTELVNMYGPTEATDIASIYRVRSTDDLNVSVLPIGSAIDNVTLYILDPALNLLPAGVAGELYIGGMGLSNGYLNRPQLNTESFIANPFGDGKLYKTGDLVRYTDAECHNIQYIGRTDHQVKIRGLRIELGEIETRLMAQPEIAEALVMAATHPQTGEDHLCAWVVAADNQPLSTDHCRQALHGQLPDYMVPSFWHVLSQFPLNANGKIDRKALPQPNFHTTRQRDLVEPRTADETTVLGIWQRVLGIDEISVDDEFFSIGGHSLKAAEVVGQLRKSFNIDLALRDLFEATTIVDQALLVARKQQSGVTIPAITKVDRTGVLPLSYAQQRLWFLAQMAPTSPAYNMPSAFRIRGKLNIQALEQALQTIVSRHESLRTAFVAIDGEPQLSILAADAHSFTLKRQAIDEAAMSAFVQQDALQAFDLTQSCLLRATLLELTGQTDTYVLALNMHHIISDGWSVQVLMRELGQLYMSFNQGLGDLLPALELQYTDYAAWQRNWLQGDVLDTQISFWRNALTGAPTLMQLPLDKPRPEVQSFNGALIKRNIPASVAQPLRKLSQQQGVTLFMTCLSAYQLLLHKYTQQDDICVGIPLAGRSMDEVTPMIGFFINALIIRTDFSANLSIKELLAQVKGTTLAAFAHEHVPIEMLLGELNIDRNLSYTPIAQCAFNMMSTSDAALPDGINDLLGDIELSLVEAENTVAKFDLQMNLLDTQSDLTLSMEYNVDIFESATVEKLVDHYLTLLSVFAEKLQPHELKPKQEQKLQRLHEIQLQTPTLPEGYIKTLPLTAMQRDIYLATLANPQTLENSLGYAFDFPVVIDEKRWQQALSDVAAQYDALNADLLEGKQAWEDIAVLGIRKQKPIDFAVLDWQHDPAMDSDISLQARLHNQVMKPYNLHEDAGVSYRLIKVAPDHYWFTLASHHLFMDGFAAVNHFTQVCARYEELVKHSDQAIPLVLDDHLEFYCHTNRQQFDTPETLQFWQQRLKDCVGLQAPSAVEKDLGEVRLLSQSMDDDHSRAVKKYCRQMGITPALYFKCLYAVLIQQYTRADGDFVITEFNAGREKLHRDTIGCFYHTQPYCVRAESLKSSLQELFNQAKVEQKQSRQHLQLSNLRLRQMLPDSSVYFSYNYLMMPHHVEMLGETFHCQRYTPNAQSMVDFRVQADGDKLSLWLAFNTADFDDLRLLERVKSLSNQLINQAGVSLENTRELDLTLAKETGPPRGSLDIAAATLPVHQLIDLCSRHNAARIAVACGEKQMTYGELEEKSNRIANTLIANGVNKGDRVGILLSRRVELLPTLLGAIKSGACYIPMDTAYPQDRLNYILEDANASVVLTENSQIDKLSPTSTAVVLDIDALPASANTSNPNVSITADDAIYMIYTSGSTGLPKGAQVYHRGESNLIDWYTREYRLTQDDAALVTSATGFDLTQKNYFALLTTGGKVVLPDTDHFDANRIIEQVAQHGITLINCAPSAFYPLLEDTAATNGIATLAQHLRLVLFGGEPIQFKRLRSWIQQPAFHADIINMYGPTECTDIATAYTLNTATARQWVEQQLNSDTDDNLQIPLGDASQGVHLFVLNEQNQPMPEGLAGELCISGLSVGAGYWHKPELTANAFFENPFSISEHDQRLYRTGDLVKQIRDNNGNVQLMYIGRKDFQVKLRGLRIELGEIEQALLNINQIDDCRVLVDDDQLLAFAITANGDSPTPEYWREALAGKLPEYMIPRALIRLDAWPLTPNGKVDRVALLALERPGQDVTFVAARNDLEQDLTTLWQEVLGVGEVGVHENFFESGGDSLKAVRLMARIELRFEVKLPVASLFGAQTIAQLAHVIDNQISEWSPVVPIQPQGGKTPIFAVHALGAMVMSYEPLARALGKDQPFYGIQAYGFEDEQTPFTDIHEMVNFYVEAIKKQQPEGPYQLIGHSFGGLIAIEIAHKLRAGGDEIRYLGLLDTHMPIRYMNIPLDDAYILKTFAEHNFGVVDIPLKALRVMKPDDMIKRVTERFNGVVSEEFIRRAIAVIRGFQRMMMNYKPRQIALAIDLYRPEIRDQTLAHKMRKLIRRDKADYLGWEKITTDIELIEVGGDHFTMLAGDHVDELVTAMKDRL